MPRKESLEKLISGEMIAPNLADALKNNPDFSDLLIYFSSRGRAYCLVEGFRYEIEMGEPPRVLERYKMSEDLFLGHANNFSKLADNGRYYFEPVQETLMRIPGILSEYLIPLGWLEGFAKLTDMELGSLLVAIGEDLLNDIKLQKNEAWKQEVPELGISCEGVAKKTLQACKSFVQGENITTEEIHNLLCSEDYTDIVELTTHIEDSESVILIKHIINITAYILTLAFYKEAGKGCSLPEILDSFQGEDLSDIFVTEILDMAQDKLISKEKMAHVLGKAEP